MLQFKPARTFRERLLFGHLMFGFFKRSRYGNVLNFGSPPILSECAEFFWLFWLMLPARGSLRYFLVADRTIVAVMVLRKKERLVRVASLAVAPRYRELGLGWHLLRFAEDSAARAGAEHLELTVLKVNTPAQRLYVRFGFAFKEEKKYSFILQKRVKRRP